MQREDNIRPAGGGGGGGGGTSWAERGQGSEESGEYNVYMVWDPHSGEEEGEERLSSLVG